MEGRRQDVCTHLSATSLMLQKLPQIQCTGARMSSHPHSKGKQQSVIHLTMCRKPAKSKAKPVTRRQVSIWTRRRWVLYKANFEWQRHSCPHRRQRTAPCQASLKKLFVAGLPVRSNEVLQKSTNSQRKQLCLHIRHRCARVHQQMTCAL